MPILVKRGEEYFEIPDKTLAKCKISKDDFVKRAEGLSSDVAGQGINWDGDCNLVDLRKCCETKKSLWASCLK
jgi:hypothetical protein